MWPVEKPSQKNNSDITVIRVSDSFKWVLFMQNFEQDVTVFNHSGSLSVFCCFLFAVFNNCWYTAPSFPFNFHKKLIT